MAKSHLMFQRLSACYTPLAVIMPSQALGSCSLTSEAGTMFPVICITALRRAGLTPRV